MPGELRYRKDLFEGTAEDYDRFRLGYPTTLLDHLRARAGFEGGRLLDLACGTGQIAFALAGHVAEVWAVDQEAGSIEFAAAKAKRLGIANIRWIVANAEAVQLEGAFDIVTIGSAFHRLDREAVAVRLVPYLANGGCIALLWGGSPTDGNLEWQRTLQATFEDWMDATGARDRIPDGWEQVLDQDPHAEVFPASRTRLRREVRVPDRRAMDPRGAHRVRVLHVLHEPRRRRRSGRSVRGRSATAAAPVQS